YQQVIEHLPTNRVVLPDYESVFRREQTEQVFQRIINGETVIVSGVKGCGKTSLLRQLEGLAHEKGKSALYINRQTLPYTAEKIQSFLLRSAESLGLEAENFEALIDLIRKQQAILLIDEYTGVLIPDLDKAEQGRHEALTRLVKLANKEKVPMAIVVHAIPKILDRALEQLSLDRESVIIPKAATKDEIDVTLSCGSIYPRGESPQSPQALIIEPGTADVTLTIAGTQPGIINELIQDIYYREKKSQKPSPRVSPSLVFDFWQGESRNFLNKPIVHRVLSLAKYHFQENKGQLTLFRHVFSLPDQEDHLQAADQIRTADSGKILAPVKEDWLRLGLVREEGNKILIDGLVIAAAVCTPKIF
ncbi:MAG: hypothetical protein DRI56_13040, partial [Chloroflexota bacterium]